MLVPRELIRTALLVVIMRSDEVRGILTDLVRRALTVE